MIKHVKSAIGILTTVVILCSFFVATAFADTMSYPFKPSTTLYTTYTGTFDSTQVTYGHESQESTCTLSFSVSVPPKTNAGILTVRGVLQKKSSTGSWLNVRTINVNVNLNNTSTTDFKYVKGEGVAYADLTKGTVYRVQFSVPSYTGSTKLSITNLTYKLDFVV